MKEHLVVTAMIVAGVALVLVIRDNMPKQSFSFKA